MKRASVRILLALLLSGGLVAGGLQAQLVTLRTVPVASGDQFLLAPGVRLGMGGVSVAVDDSLADGWSNPARGALQGPSVFATAPTLYAMSGNRGGGRTLPLLGLFSGRTWFGGGLVALQHIDDREAWEPWVGFLVDPAPGWPGRQNLLRDGNHRNLYAAGYLGRSVGVDGWSLGVGASAAGLDAMDGVDQLYQNAVDIRQDGSVVDVRVGAFRDGHQDRLSVVLLHRRVTMRHDVTTLRWGPADGLLSFQPVFTTERHRDDSRTWGGQVAWDRSLTAPGWRVGAHATLNRKLHPSLPDYELQNIPRDPGETWAWEWSAGLSRDRGPLLFALEVGLQPIWSDTWQNADTATTAANGRTLAAGERTIENDFFFANVLFRTGLEYRTARWGVQGGMEARSIDYELEQVDHVAGTRRDQKEGWTEWVPTAGVSGRLGDLDVRYVLRATTGTGRPGVAFDGTRFTDAPAGDFIPAPAGPLTLQEVTVWTHQISVVVPLR